MEKEVKSTKYFGGAHWPNLAKLTMSKSDVWLTVHRNSVWIR
jgi:hypothetical protein